jgi:hypothetical protein
MQDKLSEKLVEDIGLQESQLPQKCEETSRAAATAVSDTEVVEIGYESSRRLWFYIWLAFSALFMVAASLFVRGIHPFHTAGLQGNQHGSIIAFRFRLFLSLSNPLHPAFRQDSGLAEVLARRHSILTGLGH